MTNERNELKRLALAATPGPWRVNTARMGDKLLGWHISANEHGSSLPVCLSDKYSEYRDAEQEIRNAFLISAAPDLLAALQGVLSVHLRPAPLPKGEGGSLSNDAGFGALHLHSS